MSRTGVIAYVSDLPLKRSGGGSYAVNWNAYTQLAKRFDVRYAGPIIPRPDLIDTAISKVQRRVLHKRGRFTYFSPDTLDRNAQMADAHIPAGADAVVFRSAARWSRYRPEVPYFVYLDAVFHTFFHNTFSLSDFVLSDLERIWKEEAEFLEGASAVFFESQWGLDRAREAYGLVGSHYFSPGRGGVIEPPPADEWIHGTHKLLSVSMNFRQKGGDVVMAAYTQLKPLIPSLSWSIVGAPPEVPVRTLEGVTCEGILDPDVPSDLRRFRELLANAFLLIHPTREDTSPLVITEAAYFGCPTVSMNQFAIPELVVSGTTGTLLDPPPASEQVATAIRELVENKRAYEDMRRATRANALEQFTWEPIGSFICDVIERRIAS
ncbi:MAG TPA: glycosyltransferase [Gemmatimonadaceae bacterium]|nr:glycosyltransferase [Gemmatimonadaceae bacterium]